MNVVVVEWILSPKKIKRQSFKMMTKDVYQKKKDEGLNFQLYKMFMFRSMMLTIIIRIELKTSEYAKWNEKKKKFQQRIILISSLVIYIVGFVQQNSYLKCFFLCVCVYPIILYEND